MTVKEFKCIIEKKIGIPPDAQRLIYAGKQFKDDHTLADYPTLTNMSTVFLVLRLVGGAERPLPPGLPVSNDDCMMCLGSPALAMPCKPVKHSCCPGCLMDYCWSEVGNDRLKTAISCPLCSTEWDLGVVKRYAGAVDREVALLGKSLSENVICRDTNIIECPGCSSYCERKNQTNSQVICLMCKKQGKKPEFCWHCMEPWTNQNSYQDCGNASCNAAGILAQIQNAPLKQVVGVTCPSVRLCPTCGASIEHNNGCKQMKCKVCKSEFCFICLRKRVSGSWQCGGYNTRCDPAPVQTKVPNNK